ACDGNRYCQRACPYKVIWFNEDKGSSEIEGDGISQMCIGCVPRVEDGVAPACARTCPGRAVHFGRIGNEEGSVHKLVREWEVALPLHPEYNTEPNVYYVPPLSSPKFDDEGRYTDEERIPLDYLQKLFGDDVEDALETLQEERERVKNGGESELIDSLIGYDWPDDFFGEYTEHPDANLNGGKQ
ncbi:MAG: 4Fe-4S dicluster domain-containing protein, partial [Halobacteria archaeon]|nr:4Fe-4S dicluster domain-containing protein [Halobacteria archaeon]